MDVRAWAMAMLAVAGTGGTAAAASQCHLVRMAELPVRFQYNRILVPITLNGTQTWIMVDTGAANSMLFDGPSRRLGLKQQTRTGEFCGVGACSRVNMTYADTLTLSGVTMKNVPFYVGGGLGENGAIGVLGRDYLSSFDIEFDLADKTMRLWHAPDCRGQSLAYWTKDPGGSTLHQDGQGGEYQVDVTLNGKSVQATLDSGAPTTIITTELAGRAGVGKDDYQGRTGETGGLFARGVAVQTAVIKTLAIGTEQVSNAKVRVADMFSGDTRQTTGRLIAERVNTDAPDMLLGADFLRSHRVLLAPEYKLIFFSYNGGPIFQVMGEAAKPALSADAPATAPAH